MEEMRTERVDCKREQTSSFPSLYPLSFFTEKHFGVILLKKKEFEGLQAHFYSAGFR